MVAAHVKDFVRYYGQSAIEHNPSVECCCTTTHHRKGVPPRVTDGSTPLTEDSPKFLTKY